MPSKGVSYSTIHMCLAWNTVAVTKFDAVIPRTASHPEVPVSMSRDPAFDTTFPICLRAKWMQRSLLIKKRDTFKKQPGKIFLLILHKINNVLQLYMLSASLCNMSNTLQHDDTSDREI